MSFISPMLAHPFPKKGLDIRFNEFVAEEKYDGHRIVVSIGQGQMSLLTGRNIKAWSRYGRDRKLPTHLLEDLQHFPDCTLDGELFVPGSRSYGVTEIENGPDLVYVIFDILRVGTQTTFHLTYEERNELLYEAVQGAVQENAVLEKHMVQLAERYPVNNMDEVHELRDRMWSEGKEGLILKRRSGLYQPGKRSKDFIKIKDLKSAVLTVTGFLPSVGQIVNRGPFAIVELEDEDGNRVSVKTRNDEECRRLEADAVAGKSNIGRQLRIEFQERTPDGGYRHPRWDRWENE